MPAARRRSAGILRQTAVAQQPIVIKFCLHVVAADTPKGKASEFFAKRAGELTSGKVKVEVCQLNAVQGQGRNEALQLGAVQMLAPSLAKFAPLGVKEFELFDLPYLFDDYKELHAVTTGPVGRPRCRSSKTRGLVGLCLLRDNGFKGDERQQAHRVPDDYKGLKMRIQSSNVLDAQMRAVGAIPRRWHSRSVSGAANRR
ncbi:MAG: TRAP transporter substrate-binding protein DctP [Betaproteobacteria bacterium]|nr:TRAP transporter substrate-binding protein DctP [Betaproteobacteria bacterium]